MPGTAFFLAPNEKAALLGFGTPERLAWAVQVVEKLGYRSRVAETHEEFISSFSQTEFKLVLIEENFQSNASSANEALQWLQRLPMAARRHCVVLLIGKGFATLNNLQAFQQSVHAVVNYDDFEALEQIVQRAESDNAAFLHLYYECQRRLTQGSIA